MFAKIAEISTINYKGNTLSFELLKEGATEPDPVPKFPVFGYRFEFQFSQYGRGYLNRFVTLDILDDESETFFNLFNGTIRNDLGVAIKLNSNVLFWGLADFQSLKKLEFRDEKRPVQIKFYTPVQFNNRLKLYDAEVQSAIAAVNEGSIVNAQFTRFFTLFEYVFANHLTNNFEFTAVIDGLNGDGAGWVTNSALFNNIYFRRNVMSDLDAEITLNDYASLLCTIFYLRWGFSITTGLPSIYSMHTGYLSGNQRVGLVESTKINVDSGRAFVNTVTNTTTALPVIEKNRILNNASSKDENPLASVTYEREGEEYDPSNPDFAGSAKTFRENNPNLTDVRFYDNYVGDTVPFDPYESDLSKKTAVIRLRKIGTGNVFDTILNRWNDAELSAIIFQDFTRNLAQSYMRFREEPRKNLNIVYDGLLDPMRNYTTDFDDSIYCIVRGTYDLMLEQTNVSDSIAIK